MAAGLVNRRGNDYFAGRLVFALRDPRGRVVGFGARRMSDSDPIPAKYVNSPEGDLFHKSSLVYGLDQSRGPRSPRRTGRSSSRATRTSSRSIRPGSRPLVASMGTALTPAQLKELRRLTRPALSLLRRGRGRRGGDAPRDGSRLPRVRRGARRGRSRPGSDPAEDAAGFEARLETAEPYPRHRVRLEIDGARSKEEAFRRVQEIVAGFDRNTEWLEAVEYAADRLDLPEELQRLLPSTVSRRGGPEVSRRVLEAGERLERDALAGVVAFPDLAPILAEVSPEHFDDELHRALRAHLVEPGEGTPETTASSPSSTRAPPPRESTRRRLGSSSSALRERQLRRELAHADPERIDDLTDQLQKVRAAAGEPV